MATDGKDDELGRAKRALEDLLVGELGKGLLHPDARTRRKAARVLAGLGLSAGAAALAEALADPDAAVRRAAAPALRHNRADSRVPRSALRPGSLRARSWRARP